MCINGCAEEWVESSRAMPWWITILFCRKKYPIWRNSPPNLKFWAKSTTNKRWILGGSSPADLHWICPSFWGLESGHYGWRCWKNQGRRKNWGQKWGPKSELLNLFDLPLILFGFLYYYLKLFYCIEAYSDGCNNRGGLFRTPMVFYFILA